MPFMPISFTFDIKSSKGHVNLLSYNFRYGGKYVVLWFPY